MTSVFAPGGKTGFAPRGAELVYAPLDFLLRHPATRRFWSSARRTGVPAGAGVTDLVLQLDPGFEGHIIDLALIGAVDVGGSDFNIKSLWTLFFDDVPYLQTRYVRQVGVGVDAAPFEGGEFDYLQAGDGTGSSWGRVDIPIPEQTLVEVRMQFFGGGTASMGWKLYGAYWPIALREEWDERERARIRRIMGRQA